MAFLDSHVSEARVLGSQALHSDLVSDPSTDEDQHERQADDALSRSVPVEAAKAIISSGDHARAASKAYLPLLRAAHRKRGRIMKKSVRALREERVRGDEGRLEEMNAPSHCAEKDVEHDQTRASVDERDGEGKQNPADHIVGYACGENHDADPVAEKVELGEDACENRESCTAWSQRGGWHHR